MFDLFGRPAPTSSSSTAILAAWPHVSPSDLRIVGLCRLLANFDAVDCKEVHHAALPCGHTRSGHPDGDWTQTPRYCDHAIAARIAALRSLRPDIADAQFSSILQHFCNTSALLDETFAARFINAVND